ncbi:MAG: hypothetical protein ACT4N5_01790 [Nitrosopumilaceae archaeon]
MTNDSFTEFYRSLVELAKSFEETNRLKIQSDLDSNVIRIYGENADSLACAKIGLEEVVELAYTVAEHHPYWNLVYNASQISKLALEKWNENLTKEDLDEISWCIEELKNTSIKLKEKQNHC